MKGEEGEMTERIAGQILEVRNTGLTNMFDVNAVMAVADGLMLHDLVVYLADSSNHRGYVDFILHGSPSA